MPCSYISDHAAELTVQYGNVSKQTIGTIQRQLLVLENQGGEKFFGEPALALQGLHPAPTATGGASSTSWPPTS